MRNFSWSLRAWSLGLAAAGALAAAEFYVSPAGSPSGDGSRLRPWDLPTALRHPRPVAPGSTIWLMAGRYEGHFVSALKGTEAAPILVRAIPGSRVTLDGGVDKQPTLQINGGGVHFQGFEVMSSAPTRVDRASGVQVSAPFTRLINLVIHDVREGILFWKTAPNSEIYGNIVYHTGWPAEDRAHGPGVYLQNTAGWKRVAANVFFNGFSLNIQAYGSKQSWVENVIFEENTAFCGGCLSERRWINMLVGGGAMGLNNTVIGNRLYYPPGRRGLNLTPCYQAGCSGLTLTGNYSAGGSFEVDPQRVTAARAIRDNIIVGAAGSPPRAGKEAAPAQPTENRIFVVPNEYEPGRALATVFNWAKDPAVAVPLGTWAKAGESIEVRDVQDYFGEPWGCQVYDGNALRVAMTAREVPQPIGGSIHPAVSMMPHFGVFVLQKAPCRPAN